MNKVNIANYVVYDLANRFNCVECQEMESEIVGIVAEKWHKKHFVTGTKDVKHNHNQHIRQNFMI